MFKGRARSKGDRETTGQMPSLSSLCLGNLLEGMKKYLCFFDPIRMGRYFKNTGCPRIKYPVSSTGQAKAG